MAVNIGSAIAYLELDTSNFSKGIKDAKGDIGQITDSSESGMGRLSAASKLLAGAGSALTKSVTLPLVGIGTASVKVGSDFESAMSQVAATMGKTTEEIHAGDEEFEKLKETAKYYGATTKYTAVQAAEGLNILAMAGLDANSSIELLPDVLNLASAGNISLEESATYLTGAMAGFSREGRRSTYYADMIAKGATLAKTDVNQLGLALSTASSTAQSYGQSSESVTLSLLRLAQQNVTGAEAATALNRAMMDLYTPTDTAKKALDKLGVSVYDSNGEAKDFNVVLMELENALSGYTKEQKNAYKNTIFSTYGLEAYNKMLASTDEGLEKFKSGLQDSMGSAAQQAETQSDNLKGSIDRMKSALEGVANVISETLIPWVRKVVDWITKVLTAFNNLSPEIQHFIVTAGTIVAAVGPVLTIISKLIGVFNMLNKAVGLVKLAFVALAGNPVGLIVAALGAVVTAVIYLWNNCDSFREGVINIFNKVVEFFQTLPDKIAEVFIMVVDSVISFGKSIADYAVEHSKAFVDGFVKGFNKIVGKTKTVVNNAYNAVKTWGSNMVTKAKSIGSDFVKWIGNKFTSLKTTLKTHLDEGYNKVKTFSTDMINKAKNIGSEFLSKLKENISKIPETVGGIFAEAINAITGKSTEFMNAGSNVLNSLWEGMTSVANSITEWIGGFAESIAQKANEVLGWFHDIIFGADEASQAVNNANMASSRRRAGGISGYVPHANGIDYIPYNGYRASLHKGERVLTAEENERYNRQISGSGDTFNFYNTQPNPVEYAKQMKKAKREILMGF